MRRKIDRITTFFHIFIVFSVLVSLVWKKSQLQEFYTMYDFMFDLFLLSSLWIFITSSTQFFINLMSASGSKIITNIVFSLCMCSIITYPVYRLGHNGRSIIYYNVIGNVLILILISMIYIVYKLQFQKKFALRTIIIGRGFESRNLARSLLRQKLLNVTIVGYISDKAFSALEVYNGNELKEDYTDIIKVLPYLGNIDSLAKVIRYHRIDHVVLTAEVDSDEKMAIIYQSCYKNNTHFNSYCDVVEMLENKIPIQTITKTKIINDLLSNSMTCSYAYDIFNRIMNITLALLGLLISMPFILIGGVLFFITNPGPIFFKQRRIGLHGKPFFIYKLRTMRKHNPERYSKYSSKNDSRIPMIGKILRKLRIDEFPQFYNILKGEMNFIGPRPEWDRLSEEYQSGIPNYYLRHSIRPGVTGMAQVNYPYGANLQDTIIKLEYDLYYIKNRNILLDLKILFKTIYVILMGEGI